MPGITTGLIGSCGAIVPGSRLKEKSPMLSLALARPLAAILMYVSPLLALGAGCSHAVDRATSPVHYIQIRDTITPMELYVSVGDQVRWQNLRGEPVKIGLLPGVDLDKATCEKGFRRFGVLDDFVTIKPREYVSLCFTRPGLVRYNVWMDPKDSKGNITRTAVIHIDRRS
ncbi:MAG TPA: hypothetical protein VHF07_01860 [Nitrospiraceae bacterium]|nr:hypothetical protein [Nitrospiraceae bacterium]